MGSIRRAGAPLVYLITDHRATNGRALPEVVARALDGLVVGPPRCRPHPPSSVAVQLRDKDLGGRALFDLGVELRALTSARGVRLFVNDRVDIALAVGADGVHLGDGALAVDDVNALAPEIEIALSTHASAQVALAAADPRVSFVVFGPVFDTPSKRAFGPAQGLSALQAACGLQIPILALGGVEPKAVPACMAAGAAGVACVRGILADDDPAKALRAFFGAIEST